MKRPVAAHNTPAPIRKERNIQFSKFPPGQVPEASDYLAQVERVEAEPIVEKRAVGVAYDLREHSLQELEGVLEDRGYHLDNTLMSKLRRALIYYVEETQLHNLGAPEKPLKHSQSAAYTQAWERHPHGDHDDTPPEWREYR
ncbi:MAG: hypothetical protein OSW77_05375 [Proteobacteria bacterium]|jgi:hypothetical protein|nr:hypothetical protein [Pseudomonadota bacterium]